MNSEVQIRSGSAGTEKQPLPWGEGGRAAPHRAGALFILRQSAAPALKAAVAFAFYGMLMGWLLDGDLIKPLRMTATITLGEDALAPWNSKGAVMFHGMLLKGVLSILFGVFFVRMVERQRWLLMSAAWLGAAGVLYGICLWLTLYYLIAPLFGWIWFPLDNHPILEGMMGYALFGGVLALLLSRSLRPALAPRWQSSDSDAPGLTGDAVLSSPAPETRMDSAPVPPSSTPQDSA
jgi:hypothetical protein